MTINFFTIAGGETYHKFIGPYIASALIHNPEATAEIVTDAPRSDALDAVCNLFPDRAVVWVNSEYPKPDTWRFVIEPHYFIGADLTYIGDVDFLILEGGIARQHDQNMKRLGLCYSNMIRPGTDRLTGLHCVQTVPYFPATQRHRILLANDGWWKEWSDEQALYQLCRRTVGLPDINARFRPGHGIHISPARQPLPSYSEKHGGQIPGWDITPERLKAVERLEKDSEWQEAKRHFDPEWIALYERIWEAAQ